MKPKMWIVLYLWLSNRIPDCGPIFQTVSHNFNPQTQNGSRDLREVELFSSSVSVKAEEDEKEKDEEVRMYLNFKIKF